MVIPEIPLPALEQLSNVLANTSTGLTGSEIGRYLRQCGIEDVIPGATKRTRLYEAFRQKQAQDRCANNIIGFIKASFSPVLYTESADYFDRKRQEINKVLGFIGLDFTEAGEFREVQKSDNLRDAARRADRLRNLLRERDVHPDVLQFCREELLVENYFHAVLEATKSVADKIRRRTGLTGDGSELIDEAFAFKGRVPHLALSSLASDSEQGEQRGFMNLLKGMFGTFRNPVAHAPRISWTITEQDALDILSLVSLAHRRIDSAVEAHRITTNSLNKT